MPEPVGDASTLVPGRVEARDDAFFVNGQRQRWRSDLTLADVVEAAALPPSHSEASCDECLDARSAPQAASRPHAGQHVYATSLNARFVARGARASTAIAPGDVVLLFQPIVGG